MNGRRLELYCVHEDNCPPLLVELDQCGIERGLRLERVLSDDSGKGDSS